MTIFGKFASASVAAITFCASTPAFAGSEQRSIHVLCDGGSLTPFCTALGDALGELHPGQTVKINPDPSGSASPQLTIRFERTRQGSHTLSGFLSWQNSAGRTGTGPEIELSATDARINPGMLIDYARTLVRHSNLPPVI